MADKPLIARRATLRDAIDANREQRKVLVRQPSMFELRFVEAHDRQLRVLQDLLVAQ